MKKIFIYLFILIALIVVAIWAFNRDVKSTLKTDIKDFSIEDTASIDKLFMATKAGEKIILTRNPNGGWVLNDTLIAREDAVNTVLKTVKRIRIKKPLGLAAIESIKKQIATLGIKVEVYQKGKLAKVFYVGGATNDSRGTYMMLADADVPIIAHLPGWEGYLTERFKPSVEEWRDRKLFSIQPNELSFLSISYPDTPIYNFKVNWRNFNNFDIVPAVQNVDSNAVRRMIKSLDGITSFAFLTDDLPLRDSVLQNHNPTIKMQFGLQNGNTHEIWLYNKNMNYLPVDPSVIGWFLDEENYFFYLPKNKDFGVFQKARHFSILQKLHSLKLEN